MEDGDGGRDDHGGDGGYHDGGDEQSKTWHMLWALGLREGALVKLLDDFFRRLKHNLRHVNIFSHNHNSPFMSYGDTIIMWQSDNSKLLPADGMREHPLWPEESTLIFSSQFYIDTCVVRWVDFCILMMIKTFNFALACDTAWKFITLVIPIPQNMAKASTKYSSLLEKENLRIMH